MERNAPAFVDYGHYQMVKSVMARNNFHPMVHPPSPYASEENTWTTIKDALGKSSINFRQAEKLLGMWATEREVSADSIRHFMLYLLCYE